MPFTIAPRGGSLSTSVQDGRPTVVMVHADPGWGGPARTMAILAEYIARRYRLVVVAPEGFVLDAVRGLPGIRILTLASGEGGLANWVRGARRILGFALDVERPLLFHANGLSALNLIAPAAIRCRCPAVVHFHSSLLASKSALYLRTWHRLGLQAWFLPVSELSADLLRSRGQSDRIVGLLGNPIEPPQPQYRRHGTHDPFRIGWIGSAKPWKGLDRVVEIASLVREPGVEWWLYGIGEAGMARPYVVEARARLRQCGLDDRVKWWGRVSDPREAFSEIDAVLVTSSRESFSRVTVEAMAFGVPVIAGQIQALTALISDGENGMLFDLREPKQAAQAVRTVMADGHTRDRLVTRGLQTAARFRPDAVGRAAEEMYAAVLAEFASARRMRSEKSGDSGVAS